jgi:hypothetical protein
MAHTSPWRGSSTGDKANNRLGKLLFNELSGVLLHGSTDLADEHQGFCLFVPLEKFEYIHKGGAGQGVSAYANAGGLSQAQLGELRYCLIGEGAATGDYSDVARSVNIAW